MHQLKDSTRRTSLFLACSVLAALPACVNVTRPAIGDAAQQPYKWRNVTIIAGGFVPGFEFSTKKRGLVYTRTDIGGVYRRDGENKDWVPLNDWAGTDRYNLMGGESVAPDPVDANRVYLAAGMYSHSTPVAILSSTDQGRTFKVNEVPFSMGGNEDGRSAGERLAVDPNQNSILYFGSRNDGLWKSSDYAATWTKVGSFPVTGHTNGIGIAFVLFDKASGKSGSPTPTIYVGMAAGTVGLYRSVDGGATWDAVTGQPAGFFAHHGAFDTDGSLYVTYGSNSGPNGMTDGAVWKYDTNGSKWIDVTPVKPDPANNHAFGYAGLTIDAKHPGTVMVSSLDRWHDGDDIFRSTDGGKTWKTIAGAAVLDGSLSRYVYWGQPKPRFGWWIGGIAIDPFNSNHAVYGTGATIWETDDLTNVDSGKPTHWRVGAKGVEETAVLDLLSPASGAHLLSALGDINGFRHADLDVSPPEGFFSIGVNSLADAGAKPDVIVRVGSSRDVVPGSYSLDAGITWTPFATAPAEGRSGGTVAISADAATVIWTPRRSPASYTRDWGKTWTACSGAPEGIRIAADRVNASKFYGCTAGQVYVSSDGGATFVEGAKGLPSSIREVRATPDHEGDVWISSDTGLFHSTDGGTTFASVPTAPIAYAIGFGKAAPHKSYPALFMSGKANGILGVFRSDDAAATWVRINDDQHGFGWREPVIGDPRIFGRVYFGTNGRGILYGDPAK